MNFKMEHDIIYFFLSSIDSLNFHPNNKAYNFTVEVPERINLSGDWEVGYAISMRVLSLMKLCTYFQIL